MSDLAFINAAEAAGVSPVVLDRPYALPSHPTPRRVAYLLNSSALVNVPGGWFPRFFHRQGPTPYTQKVNFAADNPTVPPQNYTFLADSYLQSLYTINQWGYQEPDINGNLSGPTPAGLMPPGQTRLARTQATQVYSRFLHTGQGDGYNFFASATASQHSQSNRATHWLGHNAVGQFNGQSIAISDRVNLFGIGDVVVDDQGHANVGMFGHSLIVRRSGQDTAGFDIPRIAYLAISSGTRAIDALFVGRGQAHTGMDLSGGTFTGPAIALSQGQRIEFKAPKVASNITGKLTSDAPPDTYVSHDGAGLTFVVGGVTVMRMTPTGIQTYVPVTP
jgi:hypothetical protein